MRISDVVVADKAYSATHRWLRPEPAHELVICASPWSPTRPFGVGIGSTAAANWLDGDAVDVEFVVVGVRWVA